MKNESANTMTNPEFIEWELPLQYDEKGRIEQSTDNAVRVLEQDPVLAGVIANNLLTGRVDVTRPLPWKRNDDQLDETDIINILYHMEVHYGLKSERRIRNAITIVSGRHEYHPIRDYLHSLSWDGTERIRYALHHFLGAEATDLVCECLKLFLLGAIHRVFVPGCKFEDMLCLVGEQGGGKSTFFRFLAVRDEWFSDDLRRLEDENVFRKMQGHWIIEMSEMIATASAKSIEEIKSFLSRQKDTYKVPYETQPKDRKRQCVFAGTSNNASFLPFDRTGNRRFLPIMTDPAKAEVHILADEAASRAYIDQLWAEAMVIYKSGEHPLRLPAAVRADLKDLQVSFMPEDSLSGIIQDFLDNYKGDVVCTSLILDRALGKDPKLARTYEGREVNDIMNNAITGWVKCGQRRFPYYGKQRAWERVHKDAGTDSDFEPAPEQVEMIFPSQP